MAHIHDRAQKCMTVMPYHPDYNKISYKNYRLGK